MPGEPEESIDWGGLKSSFRDWVNVENLPSQFAVAWSGGLDSSVLLFGLKSLGLDVMAWHIDHGWHAVSSQVAVDCALLASRSGIPFDQLCLPQEYARNNREGEARRMRYDAFDELSKKHQLDNVFLAHHADDQQETVLMRMLQGAGYQGLRGIASKRVHHGMTIWRPLLHVCKNEIRQLAMSCHVPWIEDPSNQDLSLWRNKIRQKMIPALKASNLDLARLTVAVKTQANAVDKKVNRKACLVPVDIGVQKVCISWSEWMSHERIVRVALLQKMMKSLFVSSTVMGRRHIELVMRWAEQGGEGGLDLSKSRIYRDKGILCLAYRK